MSEQAKKTQQPLIGKVVSTKMEQTVVVLIEDKVKHKFYQKYTLRHRKILAHDATNSCKEGNTVQISQTKPISKRKAWKVVKIID